MSADKLAAALAGLTERQYTNREIATSLCNAIREQVCKAVAQMPEDWDGHEIRQLLIDLFVGETTPTMRDKRSRRHRAYQEACAQHNYWRK